MEHFQGLLSASRTWLRPGHHVHQNSVSILLRSALGGVPSDLSWKSYALVRG